MAKKLKAKREHKDAVRIQPILISAVERGWDAAGPAWLEVSQEIQRCLNRLWFAWQWWHEQQGNPAKVDAWMREYRDWAKEWAGKKDGNHPAPQCPVNPWPSPCGKFAYHKIKDAGIHTNIANVVQAMQNEYKDLVKHAAKKSAFKRWHHVLTDRGERPTYSNPQPIPLHPTKLALVPPKEKDGPWQARITADRVPATESKRTTSHEELVTLKSTGRHAGKIRRILEECHAGTRKLRGSMLAQRDGRWTLLLAYNEACESPAGLDQDKHAVLVPMRHRAWGLRIAGQRRVRWVGSRGSLLRFKRRQLREKNRTTREAYRLGHRKGHGRDRVGFAEEANVMDHFKKTFDSQMIADVVREMKEAGAGVVYYRRPEQSVWAGRLKTRFLLCEGMPAGETGSWPWQRTEVLLKNACQRAGISVKEIKPRAVRCRENHRDRSNYASAAGNGACGNSSVTGGNGRGEKNGTARKAARKVLTGG